MQYHVTFQLAGEERTEAVEAMDAASAVNQIQFEHGRGDELFELISVTLEDSASTEDEHTED